MTTHKDVATAVQQMIGR